MSDNGPQAFVSTDKEYEFVSAMVRYNVDKIWDTFGLFIKIYSAIIGGSVWLSMHDKIGPNKLAYARLSNVLVVVVAAFTIVMIYEHLRSWRGYRTAQSQLGGKKPDGSCRIAKPRVFRSSVVEVVMVLSITIAAGLFCLFNPFAP